MIADHFIPLDKSWTIRMAILDLLNGRSLATCTFLLNQQTISDDLSALYEAIVTWDAGVPVDVGESGTLYRFLKFAAWKLGLQKEFLRRGTLLTRAITDDPSIVNLPQRELLKLDNGTSQWASAAALLGDKDRLPDPPFKLALTYEAIDHWNAASSSSCGIAWEPRKDQTIRRQAEAFNELFHRGRLTFKAEQAEDFCFAYVFCGMSAAEGAKRWPSLRGHESDRITEVVRARAQAVKGEVVQSLDHRVVQAVAMFCVMNNQPLLFAHRYAVNKSWPRFWGFLEQYQ